MLIINLVQNFKLFFKNFVYNKDVFNILKYIVLYNNNYHGRTETDTTKTKEEAIYNC